MASARLTPKQLTMLRLVQRDGDPWSCWDRQHERMDQFERTLRSLERRELVQDGRHIGEDGRTVNGPRYMLTDAGLAALDDEKQGNDHGQR